MNKNAYIQIIYGISLGLCSITTVEFTAQIYDCVDLEWKSGTQETKVYDLCCGSSEDGEPACNNQNISASALGSDNLCESNSNVETYYSTYYECIYGSRGVSEEYIKEIECGTSFETGSNTKNRVCDILSDKWLWETSCECELRQAMVGMYGNSDYENDLKLNLQAEFNAGYADLKATLEGWKEYYGCGAGMKFECDIYDGTTVDTPSPIENTGGDTPSPSAPTSPTAPTMPTMPTTDESSAFCLNNFYVFCVISLFLSFCL